VDEALERLAFLDFGDEAEAPAPDRPPLIAPAPRYNLKAVLLRLCERLREMGAAACFKEITHPWVAARGLHCVKAVTPGLYPLWFGRRAHRFAVTDRLRRLHLELHARPLTGADDLNLTTHPLS
jgi:hypothetical protein